MESKLMKPKLIPKPILLKDYLLDDLSSCSSNGFKSFPRRQCCTTVRFLTDSDSKNKHKNQQFSHKNNKTQPVFSKNPSKSASATALSAFQSVLKAVKHLPFVGNKSPAPSTAAKQRKIKKKTILPRSLSRKLLKKTFWTRNPIYKEIEQWESFDEVAKDKSEQLDSFTFTCSTSESESKSYSWSDSDFTVSEGNSSETAILNLTGMNGDTDDVVLEKKEAVTNGVSDETAAVVTTTTTTSSTDSNSTQSIEKEWPNEEKEQFSPVSILDCPFVDDDDEVSSPFPHRLPQMEGANKMLMKKIQRFECLSQLQPIDLTTRFAAPESDDEPNESTLSTEKTGQGITPEEQAQQLVHHVKNITTTTPSEDKLLLDFFVEVITNRHNMGHLFDKNEVICEATEWINGQSRDLRLGWEVEKQRLGYIKDMEKGEEWKKLDEENEELALELEALFFASLMNELLLDLQC